MARPAPRFPTEPCSVGRVLWMDPRLQLTSDLRICGGFARASYLTRLQLNWAVMRPTNIFPVNVLSGTSVCDSEV